MGRWGDGAFDSDGSLDFFASEITRPILREIAYLMTPETLSYQSKSGWLLDTLTIIEILLLFDEHQIGSSAHIANLTDAVKRWREAIIKIWDDDWQDESRLDNIPYSSQAYREEHRLQVVGYFDRLSELAIFWDNAWDPDDELTNYIPQKSLPFFSSGVGKYGNGETYYWTGEIIHFLINHLKQQIIYTLADENADTVRGIYAYYDHIWISVEVLGFICKTYRLSPQVTQDHIKAWERKANQIWDDYYKPLNADDDWIPVSGESFQRLREVAKTYPPRRW